MAPDLRADEHPGFLLEDQLESADPAGSNRSCDVVVVDDDYCCCRDAGEIDNEHAGHFDEIGLVCVGHQSRSSGI